MLNKKVLLISTVLSSLCLIKNGAYAMEEFTIDKPKTVGAVRLVTDKLLEITLDSLNKELTSPEITNEFCEEIKERANKERRYFFNLRLVSSLWKKDVEGTIRSKKLLSISLSPQNFRDEAIKGLAPLTTYLSLKGWDNGNLSQIEELKRTLTNYNFENVKKFKTNLKFELHEILQKNHHIISFDEMPSEMRTAVAKTLAENIYEGDHKKFCANQYASECGEYLIKDKGIHAILGSFFQKEAALNHYANELIFKEQRHSFFDLRLVSSVWKEAVDDVILRKKILKICLSPENAKDEVIYRLAPLTTTLTFSGWDLQNFYHINSILSNNSFENISNITLPTNLSFDLSEILRALSKITTLRLEGRIFTSSAGVNFYGNSNMCLPLLKLHENQKKNLTHLSLKANNLKDDIMVYILLATKIGYFKNLLTLDLSRNKITPMGLQIFNYIKPEQLRCIEVIKLGHNPLLHSNNLASEKVIEHIVTTFPTLIALDATECLLNQKYLRKVNRVVGEKKIVFNEKDFSHLLLGKELGKDPEIEYLSDESDDSDDSDECVVQ